jgi:type IV pilus assembly protein PilZ
MSSAGDNNKPSDGNGHGGARRSMPPGERGERPSLSPEGTERRSFPRFDVEWAVDYASGDTFLYSYITNISEMGIFIASEAPPKLGTRLSLKFTPAGEAPFALEGEVAWINPMRPDGENLNPGFGVRFVDLDTDARERLVGLVHAIAYLPEEDLPRP